jgi:hypothetical protein
MLAAKLDNRVQVRARVGAAWAGLQMRFNFVAVTGNERPVNQVAE